MLSRQAEREVKTMGRKGEYKQETILFGLRDWILDRWDQAKIHADWPKLEQQKGNRSFELGLGVVEEGIQTSFYVSQKGVRQMKRG